MDEPGAAPDPRQLLDVAVWVARHAADEARRRRAQGIADLGTKTTATDLVTAADRAVERLVAELLQQRRPGDTMLGEEYGSALGHGSDRAAEQRPDPALAHRSEAAAGAVRWIVDPIDGTVNYVYDIPFYAVSIAAQVNGATVAGVVRNPVTGEEWTAVRRGGAWRDGRRLACSRVVDPGRALVATGFGYDARRRAHQAQVLAQILPRVRDIRRIGAAALDLCYVAEGRIDAYFEKGLNLWDLAAGELIATEAGVRVGGLRGAGSGPQMVLAAPEPLFQRLHDLLVAHDADGGP
jgi:myo-inositol-1(or 4)-monophosphatase